MMDAKKLIALLADIAEIKETNQQIKSTVVDLNEWVSNLATMQLKELKNENEVLRKKTDEVIEENFTL